MQRLFVSKSRQVKCDIQIRLYEVAGIPLVTGTYSVRWKIRGMLEGQTESLPLKNHAVEFTEDNGGKIASPGSILFIGKDGVVQPQELKLYVVHVLHL